MVAVDNDAGSAPVAQEQHECMTGQMISESQDASPCTTVFGSFWMDMVNHGCGVVDFHRTRSKAADNNLPFEAWTWFKASRSTLR